MKVWHEVAAATGAGLAAGMLALGIGNEAVHADSQLNNEVLSCESALWPTPHLAAELPLGCYALNDDYWTKLQAQGLPYPFPQQVIAAPNPNTTGTTTDSMYELPAAGDLHARFYVEPATLAAEQEDAKRTCLLWGLGTAGILGVGLDGYARPKRRRLNQHIQLIIAKAESFLVQNSTEAD